MQHRTDHQPIAWTCPVDGRPVTVEMADMARDHGPHFSADYPPHGPACCWERCDHEPTYTAPEVVR